VRKVARQQRANAAGGRFQEEEKKMVRDRVKKIQTEAPADWAPGMPCPRCGKRHQTWFRVASCRWHKGLCWVCGHAPATGPCFASVSFCRHPGYRSDYVTVMLFPAPEEAEAAKATIDRTGCGGACSRQHRLYEMHPAPQRAKV
jgi:hypothetical protein